MRVSWSIVHYIAWQTRAFHTFTKAGLMLHRICGVVACVFFIPALIWAVTWQMDSAPFVFSSVATINPGRTDASHPAIICRSDVARGVVTIRYNLSAGAPDATLSVYSVAGIRLATFDLHVGSNALQWGTPGKRIAAGTYVAIVRGRGAEITTQLSVTK